MQAEFTVKRFPIDSELAFYRIEVSAGDGIDRLAGLVEMLQARLDEVTSEVKTVLREDGGAFILAFLPDKRPMSREDVEALCGEAADDHARDTGEDGENS